MTLWCIYFWQVVAYELLPAVGDHLGDSPERQAAWAALCGG